jgi:ERCC4-related helicase
VSGRSDRPATERIIIAATFRQDDDAAATGLLEDTLTVIGGAMVAYDSGMVADRRSEVLLEVGEAALSVGEAHLDSAEVHYVLSFNDVSGRLEIMAATLGAEHG